LSDIHRKSAEKI